MDFTGERYVPCEETQNQPIEREHWQRYIFSRTLFSDSAYVLDIACGEGYGSNYLAEKVEKVIGVDISEEAVEHARKTYNKENLDFVQGSVTHIPLRSQSVDGVVSFETIEHVNANEQIKFLQEIKRVLKKDGLLVLSCPNKPIASDRAYELWGYINPFHKKEYEIDEFKELLENYFKYVFFLYQRTETNLILSIENPPKLEVIWGEKKKVHDTQNIIAVCCDEKIKMEFPNLIILDNSFAYLQMQKELSDLVKANNENISTISETKRLLALKENMIEEKTTNEIKMQTDLASYQKNNQSLLEKAKNLECDFQKMSQHLTEIINEKQNYIITVEQENIKQKIEIEKLNNLYEVEKNNCNTLRQELQKIYSSLFWRVTKPLRKIFKFD